MKLIELVNSVEALNELAKTKLPAATSFKLANFMNENAKKIEDYHSVRNEKLETYGEVVLDDDGKEVEPKQFRFVGDNGKKFLEEMAELEKTELDVKIPEIKLSELGAATIEPKHLMLLKWLIKE